MVGHRINWLDNAKAISIVLVVMMHATLGVGNAFGGEGWMHNVVQFAQPFRIPTFFLLSGLLVHHFVGKSWRWYLDRKVLFYAYFYVLWLTIQFALKAPGMAASEGWSGVLTNYLAAYVQPFGILWFIYVLPIFMVVTKLVSHLPKWLPLAVAFVLLAAPIQSGWLVLDASASNFFYFYLGYALRRPIMDYAQEVIGHPRRSLMMLAAWAIAHGVLLNHLDFPGVSIALALGGACAVVTVGTLLRFVDDIGWFSWIGRNTIVVYLAFFLPMAVTRTVLLKTGLVTDIGTVSLITTIAAVVGPIVLYAIISRIGYGRFLFERPKAFQLTMTSGGKRSKTTKVVAPAE